MKLRCENVRKNFGCLNVIDDINFDIRDSEFFCFIGPSGCGKTTLLRIMAGVEKVDEGKIFLDDREIHGVRNGRGMVFQESALFPWRTVRKNIELGLEIKRMPPDERRKVSDHYIKITNLRGFEGSYPYQLSGGMKQKVSLARTMATNPGILLMDEPFASLDAQTREWMQDELLSIWGREKKTVVFVTHAVDEAVYLGDRIALLTRRPAGVKKIFENPVRRPRERDSGALIEIKKKILEGLGEEVRNQ